MVWNMRKPCGNIPQKVGNACMKKGPFEDVTPQRNLSYIIEMIKIYLLEILELDAVCL